MAIAIGDLAHTAIWLDGKETEEEIARWKREAPEAMAGWAAQRGWKIGPVELTTLRPGDRRCPKVPDHIQGPDVRLLAAEAEIVGTVFVTKEKPGFAHDLEPDDFAKLAVITRRRYREAYPNEPELSDAQVRTLINDLGLETALDTLRDIRPSDLI
jgi:hypothetical protein